MIVDVDAARLGLAPDQPTPGYHVEANPQGIEELLRLLRWKSSARMNSAPCAVLPLASPRGHGRVLHHNTQSR